MHQNELGIEVVYSERLAEKREVLVIAFEARISELPERFNELDQTLGGILSTALARGDFQGKAGEGMLLNLSGNSPERVFLVGLGSEEDFNIETVRESFGKNIKKLAKLNLKTVSIDLRSFCTSDLKSEIYAELISEVAQMALWEDNRYKTSKNDAEKRKLSKIEILWDDEKDSEVFENSVHKGEVFGVGSNVTKELVAMPANELYPIEMANIAKEIASGHNFSATVLGESELKEMGMNALLAVGNGSANESCLIIIDTKPGSKQQPYALVGKGLTFDSGGISIKPSLNMHEMKGDMAGSAVVLAVIDALGKLDFDQRVIAAIPAAENMTGAQAQRPGDIVKAYDGTTVEVLNTDAEGRLVLADTLAYISKEYNPKWIIDLATLTGAISIALGQWAIGMMGNNDALCNALERAGDNTYERVWRLPLFDEYKEQIKSPIADIQNIGGREAGSITAALFLEHFVNDIPWVHLDIAGVSWINKERDYVPKGPSGIGTRLILDLLLNQIPVN